MEEMKRVTTKLHAPKKVPLGSLLAVIRGDRHKGYKKQRLEHLSSERTKTDTVITQKDNGKIVLRRNSFQESRSTTRLVSSYNSIPINSLVSIGRDIHEREVKEGKESTVDNNNNNRGISHHGNNTIVTSATTKEDVCLDDEVPQFRRERRGAIAEVSKRDRKDIVNTLRTRCVAHSLTVTGLIETGR